MRWDEAGRGVAGGGGDVAAARLRRRAARVEKYEIEPFFRNVARSGNARQLDFLHRCSRTPSD